MLYLASTSAGAFGETIARRRLNLDLLAHAGAAALRPVVSASWRQGRRLSVTVLTTGLPFVDIAAAASLYRSHDGMHTNV